MANQALEELRGKVFPVLDKGHVVLLDCMGSDHDIVDAARLSYGKGTRSVSDDRTLIRYLMRHKHGTPFEMAEIKVGVRVPMDTWRQWIRHRTASVNEYSTRYSEAIDDMQETAPGEWRLQDGANKQGSGGKVTEWPEGNGLGPDFETPGDFLSARERIVQEGVREMYRERLAFGVAREQARKDLPLSTYTEAYWKCDLRNVLGFLAQRMDSHAQREIRAYADVIGHDIVAKLFPATWGAFLDYTLWSMTLSATDQRIIQSVTRGATFDDACDVWGLGNKRERDECRTKLQRLGVIA